MAVHEPRLIASSVFAKKGASGTRAAKVNAVPFMSVTARTGMGAQYEVWFPQLPLDEVDLDEALHLLLSKGIRR